MPDSQTLEHSNTQYIIFANQKGGTGKTTSCMGVAGHLLKAGHKVLAVDLDPQANLTLGLGITRTMTENTIYDAILKYCIGYEGKDLAQVIVETGVENLHLAPAEPDLSVAEILMQNSIDRTAIILETFRSMDGQYDYVLFDSPPHLGLLMLNGLRISSHVVIPVDAGIFSLKSLENFNNYCREMETMTGHAIEHMTIVLTRCVKKGFLAKITGKRTAADEIKESLGKMYEKFFCIPDSQDIHRSHKAGMPISHFAPGSRVSAAYKHLSSHIIKTGKF